MSWIFIIRPAILLKGLFTSLDHSKVIFRDIKKTHVCPVIIKYNKTYMSLIL